MRALRLALLALFLLPALPAIGADVCCLCQRTGEDPQCITAPEETGQTFDPNTRTFYTANTAEACGGAWANGHGLNEWTCTKFVSSAQCQPVGTGAGICQNTPITYLDAREQSARAQTEAVAPIGQTQPIRQKAIIPQLNVPIPGLTFTGGESTDTETSSLLAQYVAAAFRFGVSITAIAATIMFIYGAFQYLVGSAITSIQNGKTIMQEAILGMILVFGATMILRTVNPATTTLEALHITGVDAESYSSALAGNKYAPDILTELGVRTGAGGAPTYSIPANCPGRSKNGGGPYPQYAMEARSGSLTQETIDQYLAEQARTGIPAAVIMAQMFNESGGACPVVNLFKNPAICGGQHSANYNFGGIGCTTRQVPTDACAHIAFPTAFVGGSKGTPYPMTIADVNKAWNDKLPNCSELVKTTTRDTYTNCGESCYPQKSHTSVWIDGKEVWIQSVQCSRKFDGPQAFLDSHLGAVRACLPYNDSVYKFAYCVGASMYATAGGKARTLANIIEQNCLCDPAKDSTGCKRDRQLEDDIADSIVKKTNLFKLYSAGQLDTAAYDRIAEALWKSTGGRLTPGPGDVIQEETSE